MRPAFHTTAAAVELAVALLQARVLRGGLSVDYCKSRGGDLGFRANKGSPMSQSVAAPEYSLPFKLHVQQTQLTEEQFIRLCQENPDLRIELTAQGELVIMPPTSLESGWRNIRIARRLDTWTEEDGTGIAFDSSTLFTLPNGAKRSPDASWMRRERWEALPKKEREGFGSICPDF